MEDKSKECCGIEETKDILEFGDKLADELLKAKEDGVITVKESLEAFKTCRKEFVHACDKLWCVPKELADLNSAEANELKEFATKVFGKYIALFAPMPPALRVLAAASGKFDVKETVEVLQFLSSFADALIEARKDGKVTVLEILEIVKRTQNDFFNAAWDAWMIPLELQDLDEYEARMLSEKITAVATKWITIFT